MKKRFIKIAFITSPIIATYGLAPIFISQQISYLALAVAFLLLSCLIGCFWFINIFLVTTKLSVSKQYIISYLLTFLLHFAISQMAPSFPEAQNTLSFLVYSVLSTIAINSIILIILHSELLKWRKDLAETEVQSLKLANLEAQKQVLLQQLQPHFLFNALSTLKSLISENAIKAEEYVIHMSEFLRYSVQANNNDLVSLDEEWQFTKDFLTLQKVRFGNALQWNCWINNHTVLEKFVPVLSLQTVVENAIKHNKFTEDEPLIISITFDANEIVIHNNKAPKQVVPQSGVGLKNLKARYDLYTNNGLTVNNQASEFIVLLKLLNK